MSKLLSFATGTLITVCLFCIPFVGWIFAGVYLTNVLGGKFDE